MFEKGLSEVEVKTDSEEALQLVKGDAHQSFPLRTLVEDSRFLLRRCKSTIQHTLKQGNRCANKLAK